MGNTAAPLATSIPRPAAERASLPWFARAVLLDPARVERRLREIERAGIVPRVPNAWQITLGVVRMWHRLIFRSEEIGTSACAVRPTWRARLLHYRPLRFPFLVMERAIAPLDSSGLLSDRERLLRHLLGAHHEGAQFIYDLEILSVDPGGFEELLRRVREVLDRDTPRSRWLKDLTVFEGYHESLLEAALRAQRGDMAVAAELRDDPDITFTAYLRWCARQPPTYEETLAAWREGRFTIADGVR